ncbi:hypothetical protein D3C85_1309580 [compost metagenome]
MIKDSQSGFPAHLNSSYIADFYRNAILVFKWNILNLFDGFQITGCLNDIANITHVEFSSAAFIIIGTYSTYNLRDRQLII